MDEQPICICCLSATATLSNQTKAHKARKCALLGIKDKYKTALVNCETQTYGLSEGNIHKKCIKLGLGLGLKYNININIRLD